MSFIVRRKHRKGPENDMVQLFINNYEPLFKKSIELSHTVFTELKIGIGFSDIVIVFWDSSKLCNWTETRKQLKIQDIKILHHIAQKENNFESQIQKKLGFSEKDLGRSLSSLEKANLVDWNNHNISIKPLSEIFFVKDIIAVEAKMKDWKSVIQQANMNTLFASQSYVLLPKAKDSSKIITESTRLNLGYLEYKKNEFSVIKKAKKNNIPVSYNSWLINEAIGRLNYEV